MADHLNSVVPAAPPARTFDGPIIIRFHSDGSETKRGVSVTYSPGGPVDTSYSKKLYYYFINCHHIFRFNKIVKYVYRSMRKIFGWDSTYCWWSRGNCWTMALATFVVKCSWVSLWSYNCCTRLGNYCRSLCVCIVLRNSVKTI